MTENLEIKKTKKNKSLKNKNDNDTELEKEFVKQLPNNQEGCKIVKRSIKSDENKINIESNKIYNMDCVDYLKNLNNRIIDCIVLDPPYFEVVNEKWDNDWDNIDDYLEWIDKIMKEIERVSKYSGSLWIFGFHYQLSKIIPIIEKYEFTYKQTIVIDKGLKSVAGRTSNKLKMFPTASEYIIYFHKESRHLIKNLLQEKKKEKNISSTDINKFLGKATNGGGTWSSIAGEKQKNIQYPTKEDWNKLEELFGKFNIKYDDYVYKFNIEQGITDVWNDINFYDRTYIKKHPTQKPYSVIERIIKCSSDENDNILDIFMGSGMSALVSRKLKRNFYGCEKEKKYFDDNLLTELKKLKDKSKDESKK